MEDWALIRRLAADGVPQRQVARQLGIGRSTVARAVASEVPPKYERSRFRRRSRRSRRGCGRCWRVPGDAGVGDRRAGRLGRVDPWFRENVARLRPQYRRPDPADRLTWAPGDAAQCDLWFPPAQDPARGRHGTLLPVLVITAAYSRFMAGRMIPTRTTRTCCGDVGADPGAGPGAAAADLGQRDRDRPWREAADGGDAALPGTLATHRAAAPA